MGNINQSFRTETINVNMGPQHPSTHGVYRALLTLDGEQVVEIENHIGYLHRGIEKIAESKTYHQFIPYTDRLDYLSAILNNWAYTGTVEKIMGIEVPEKAEYLRVIMGELQRIANHLVFLASYALDFNSFTGWMYAFRDREYILDLFEMVAGGRLTVNYTRIGGVSGDLPPEFFEKLPSTLDSILKGCDELDGLLTGNEIFQARTKNVGIIDTETAISYGITGPNLRATGFKYDLRKDCPYSIYDRFNFEIPICENGDSFDRWIIRLAEIRQSVAIIKQAFKQIPDQGDILAKVPKTIKPPEGECYFQIEGAKGILGFFLVSDGSKYPYRLRIHGPSFIHISAFPEIARGGNIQDAVAILASLDIVLGEIDR